MTLNATPLNSAPLNAPGTTEAGGAFYDSWYRTVRSHQGIVAPGVAVHVYNAVDRNNPESEDNTPATLYADAAGEQSLDNPFTTGSDGVALFHAAAGFYHVKFVQGADVLWLKNQPLGDMKAQSADAVDLLSGALAGVDFTSAAALVHGLLASYDFRALPDCADDTEAAAAGVSAGALYRTGNNIKTRLT